MKILWLGLNRLTSSPTYWSVEAVIHIMDAAASEHLFLYGAAGCAQSHRFSSIASLANDNPTVQQTSPLSIFVTGRAER